jgi:ElaB/YqjD/DUF883 family membrane-anchored ribosome-binding protein
LSEGERVYDKDDPPVEKSYVVEQLVFDAINARNAIVRMINQNKADFRMKQLLEDKDNLMKTSQMYKARKKLFKIKKKTKTLLKKLRFTNKYMNEDKSRLDEIGKRESTLIIENFE